MNKFSQIQPYLYTTKPNQSHFNITITKKGDLGVSFKLNLPEINTLSNSELENIHNELNKAIIDLPYGSVFHKQDYFFKKIHKSTNLKRENLLYVEHEKHFYERSFMDCESYIHLSLCSDDFLTRKVNTSIFSNFGKGRFVNNKKAEEFLLCCEKFELQMQKIGVNITPLNRAESIKLKYKYFTFSKDGNVLGDFCFDEEMRIADKKIDIYSISNTEEMPIQAQTHSEVKKYSNERSRYVASFLYPISFELECDHILNTIIHRADENKIKTDINYDNEHKVKALGRISTYNQKVYLNNNSYVTDCDNDTLNACRMHFNIIVASSEQDQKINRNNVELALNDLGIKPNKNYIRLGNVFWASAPCNAGDMPYELMPHSFIQVASCFTNWESNYKSAVDGILLYDRIKQVPVVIDLWDKPYNDKVIANRNACLFGFSGEGKSVLLNHIFSQYLEQDYSLVILDIGDSYKKLCLLYGGLYFKYDINKPLFNPFKCKDAKPDVDFIESLVDMIFIAWYGGKKEPERKTESVIKEGLAEYYEFLSANKNVAAGFDSYMDFYKSVRYEKDKRLKDSTFDIEDYMLVMKEFQTGGIYGNVFNGEMSIDVEKSNFIIFELDNIKDNKVLFPIIAHVITHTINNTIFQKVGKKKAIWVDEAWKVLENEGMKSFLKYLYKTIRKKEGQVGIAVQDINDIPKTEIGETILNNSAIKLMMPHVKNINSIPIIADRASLTEKAKNQLGSLKSDFTVGRYTELMIVLGNESKPYRLELTPYSYYAFTSNESENKEIYGYYEETKNMKTAIIKMIDKHSKRK